jgi:Mrp family chromosome partitioning ATPase
MRSWGRGVRRHWWVVVAGLVLGIGGGLLALNRSTPVYAASTSVLVQPDGASPVNLPTEAQLARSTQIAVDAAVHLTGVPFDRIVEATSVQTIEGSSVLVIRFEAAAPSDAAAGANAVAQAYLANRARVQRAALDAQTAAIARKLSELAAQIAAVNARMAALPVDSPQLTNLRGTRSLLTGQAATLAARSDALATTTIDPGRVIQAADQPTRPARPEPALFLAVGALAGAILGWGAGLARDRLASRVRDGAGMARRSGVNVLAELPPEAGMASPRGAGGRAFNRLRNEVVSALGQQDRVVLVTGASPGAGSTIVAANLAASLARADNDVILVGANVPEIGRDAIPLSRLFDVGDIPGLTDTLSGRAQLAAVLQRPPRSPRLCVVTPGATASAAGLLQAEPVRAVLRALRRQARYILVEAPSAATGADAQSLAGVADAAILVVEAGRTRYSEVHDAANQLRAVRTRVLGAVVVPRLAPAPVTEPAEIAPAPDTWSSEPEPPAEPRGTTVEGLDHVPTTVDTPTMPVAIIKGREHS